MQHHEGSKQQVTKPKKRRKKKSTENQRSSGLRKKCFRQGNFFFCLFIWVNNYFVASYFSYKKSTSFCLRFEKLYAFLNWKYCCSIWWIRLCSLDYAHFNFFFDYKTTMIYLITINLSVLKATCRRIPSNSGEKKDSYSDLHTFQNIQRKRKQKFFMQIINFSIFFLRIFWNSFWAGNKQNRSKKMSCSKI